MLAVRIRWDYNEATLREYQDLLAERRRRVLDMRPALSVIEHDFFDLEDAIFRSEGRLINARWKPLNKAYARWKLRRGMSPRTLEMARGGRVGRLRKSLTYPGAPWQVLRMNDTSIEIGTNLGIAPVHQKGGTVQLQGTRTRTVNRGNITPGVGATVERVKVTQTRTAKIPRRRFVSLRRADKDRWLGYFAAYIHKGEVHIRRGGV